MQGRGWGLRPEVQEHRKGELAAPAKGSHVGRGKGGHPQVSILTSRADAATRLGPHGEGQI